MARAAAPRDRFVTANGLRLRYRDWGGPGPPLVALHGAAAHAHWWDPVAPYLAGRVRVLALDWRGHGRSAWPRPPAYRIEDFVADLREVIERLRLECVGIAAHSMGGHIALAFAAWHPDRVGRLCVVDAKPGAGLKHRGDLDPRPARASVEFPTRAAALRRFHLRPPETTASPALLRAVSAAGVRRLESGGWAYRVDPMCKRTRIPVDAWPLLDRITAPTLVVRGEYSTILPRDVAERMVKAIPSAQLEEIRGAHHHVTLDAPAALAAAILTWLGIA